MKEFLRLLKEVLCIYKPVRSPGFADRGRSALAMWVGAPTVFVLPLLHALPAVITQPSKEGVQGALLILLHFLMAPILLLYIAVLPFVGCKIYLHTPQGIAMIKVKKLLQSFKKKLSEEQNRQDAG